MKFQYWKEAIVAVTLGTYVWSPSFATAFGLLVAFAAYEFGQYFKKPDENIPALQQQMIALRSDLEEVNNKVSALSMKAATTLGWNKRGS